ncbi:MAG: hypothetical protein PHH86_07190 [Sphaerochaetaceae bacterium]|nr:hypothetical protein [Sphaerochaetaceae bacterium]
MNTTLELLVERYCMYLVSEAAIPGVKGAMKCLSVSTGSKVEPREHEPSWSRPYPDGVFNAGRTGL